MEKVKLFCIPYAGASATVFYKFSKYLSKNISLIPVELAGRGSRFEEKPIYKFDEELMDIKGTIENQIIDNSEFIIFGFSYGSLLAYEVTKLLQSEPLHLILGGYQYPAYKTNTDILELNDYDFLKNLEESGGISIENSEDFDVFKPFIPVIRSDFESIKSHKFNINSLPLSCDGTILYTDEDEFSQDIKLWNTLFSRRCEYHKFLGNHFFINRDFKEIALIINSIVEKKMLKEAI